MDHHEYRSGGAKSLPERVVGHFRTITKHRHTVMDLCFKVGLIKEGLLHDLSKYSPVEFFTGVKYYQGTRSPNAAEREDRGYSAAWLHHKGRNRHHYEYWYDVYPEGDGPVVRTGKMPLNNVLEMACDRIAACRIYHGDNYKDSDPWDYYCRRSIRVGETLHPDTRKLLEKILIILRDQGEKQAVAYMRYMLLHPDKY